MEPQTRRRAAWADIREFLVRAGALAALLVMLFGVVFGLYIQPDAAMHPHLKPGDLLLFYRLPRSCTAGEVVVFTKDGQRRTGRVAARGGDTVEVTDAAALVINGSTVAEPDIYEETPKYGSNVTYPLTLADGEYFYIMRRPRRHPRQPLVRPGAGRGDTGPRDRCIAAEWDIKGRPCRCRPPFLPSHPSHKTRYLP